MAVPITRITIVGGSDEAASGVDDLLSFDTTQPELMLPAVRNYLQRLQAGVRKATVYIAVDSATDATVPSATITVNSNPTAGDTVTIGGKTFTFVTSGTAEGEVVRNASTTTVATNLKNAINAHTGLTGQVVATSSTNVVTVSGVVPGKAGNLVTLTQAYDGGTAASKAYTFTDVGEVGDTITVGTVTWTLVAGAPGADEVQIGADVTESGDNLAAAINGHASLTGVVTAANVAGVVTVSASSKGLWGNHIPIAETSGAGNHGAWAGGALFLSGGAGALELSLSAAALSGGSGTVQLSVASYEYGT